MNDGSANFYSEGACIYLAKFIDDAKKLSYLGIKGQKGKRKVKVLIKYAEWEPFSQFKAPSVKPGLIQVRAKRDGKVIKERPTNKMGIDKVDIAY